MSGCSGCYNKTQIMLHFSQFWGLLGATSRVPEASSHCIRTWWAEGRGLSGSFSKDTNP